MLPSMELCAYKIWNLKYHTNNKLDHNLHSTNTVPVHTDVQHWKLEQLVKKRRLWAAETPNGVQEADPPQLWDFLNFRHVTESILYTQV